jgi:fumarate hydratase subunit beta
MYVGRDTAHKRMVEALDQGKPLPFDIRGATMYYMGPSPARPGRIIGSAGPTTSGRMDAYSPRLIAEGLKGMVGKGPRSKAVKDAMAKYKAVYLGAIGGAGAIISKSIRKAGVIAYEELGAEALQCLEAEDFPVTVINDIYGGDLYEEGKAKYRSCPPPNTESH